MEKKFNFVYISTNMINGKQYVGDHSSNDLNNYNTTNYLGSGLLIIKAKQKYGKENFKREILEFFSTKQEAFDAQEKYIQLYNTVKPNGYNISAKGGNQVVGGVSEETRQKMSLSQTGKKQSPETIAKRKNKKLSDEHKLKISKANLGKIRSEESKQKYSNCKKGMKLSIETKEKLRKINLGKTPTNKGIKLSDEARLKLHKPHKKFSIEALEKRKCVNKIKCEYCNKEFFPWHHAMWHGEKCKLNLKNG